MEVYFESPFSIQFEVAIPENHPGKRRCILQYRVDPGDWNEVVPADFPYPDAQTPDVSIVPSFASYLALPPGDTLTRSKIEKIGGAGLSLSAKTPVWSKTGGTVRWEWPLVIRRFSDGPTFTEDGTRSQFRLVDAGGAPLPGLAPLEITARAPEGLLAGTFIETPARIGPYQSDSGNLYFIMEPAETDNRMMMVKSEDFGKSWREVDGNNRPTADDLEGVGTTLTEGTIHILHQTSDAVYYHAFNLEDHPDRPDQWAVDSEVIARPGEPPVQVAALEARPDGSLLAVYGTPSGITLQFRNPEGIWSPGIEVDAGENTHLSGPQMVSNSKGEVYLAYRGSDGSAWVRTVLSDNTLSPPQLFATGMGLSEAEQGAILPLLYLPESDAVVMVYRMESGLLWERRLSGAGSLSDPVKISDLPVVINAVDSDQTGADAITYQNQVHLTFIDEDTRSIFYTFSREDGSWETPQVEIGNIDACWIRGSRLKGMDGNSIYGFVFDAGSRSGRGLNRYHSIPLQPTT
jgi:hypothetical protein